MINLRHVVMVVIGCKMSDRPSVQSMIDQLSERNAMPPPAGQAPNDPLHREAIGILVDDAVPRHVAALDARLASVSAELSDMADLYYYSRWALSPVATLHVVPPATCEKHCLARATMPG